MKDIAIVKLVKGIFGNVFGKKEETEEKTEKMTLVNEIDKGSDTEKSTEAKEPPKVKKEVTAEKKNVAKKKTTTAKKKTVAKKSVDKKPTEKKKTSTVKTAKAAPKGTKKAEKIALYTKAIKKQYGEVDESFLEIIVKNLGPSIYKKDAELVSCSDPKELDTVRKNFLMKKLGLEDDKDVLDAAIKDVCEELKGTSKKYRAIFYYRLAQKFKKESVLS